MIVLDMMILGAMRLLSVRDARAPCRSGSACSRTTGDRGVERSSAWRRTRRTPLWLRKARRRGRVVGATMRRTDAERRPLWERDDAPSDRDGKRDGRLPATG